MMTREFIVLVTKPTDKQPVPQIATFEGGELVGIEVPDKAIAMHNFDFSVRMNTDQPQEIHPYANGIGINYAAREAMLVEQEDFFDYKCPGEETINVYMYTIDDAVTLHSVAGKEFFGWVDQAQLNASLLKLSDARGMMIAQRTLDKLTRPNWPNE